MGKRYFHDYARLQMQAPDPRVQAWAIVVGAGVGLVGSALSADAAGDQADAAREGTAVSEARLLRTEKNVNEAIANLRALTPPSLVNLVQPYQRAVIQGQITPEEAQFRMLEDSKLAGINVDPALLSAQTNALQKITEIAEQGGMTAIDRARLLDIQDQQSARARGEQEAMTQDAQRRGIAGSGIEQVGRMLSQQGSATRSAAAGVNVAAEAQRRALEAIQAQGTMAGSMRTQDFAEQAKKAEAADAISKYNNSFANATSAANVASRNAAAERNLAERQRISEYNIGQAEKESAARMAATQSDWQNAVNKEQNIGNLAAGQATSATQGSIAANTLANTQNQNANALYGTAIQQGAEGIGDLVKLWNKED